jgi:hypothetical protein
MANGFLAVPVHSDSTKFFAFQTPMGKYEFNRTPFGWCASPGYYTEFMQRLLIHMPTASVMAYIDDILVHTSDTSSETMLYLVERLLQRVCELGAKVKTAKTRLFQTRVEYLGFIIAADKIEMDPSYRDALLKFTPPRNPAALARFLGMLQYYRQFLPKMAMRTARLHAKKHEKPWIPLDLEDLEAFYLLKTDLLNSEALSTPDYSSMGEHLFILALDWSTTASAVTLSQFQVGRDGVLRRRLLFWTGKKGSEASKHFSSTKGEISALVWGMTIWHHILMFAPFMVETDSMSVRHISTLKQGQGVYVRWYEVIAQFMLWCSIAPWWSPTG